MKSIVDREQTNSSFQNANNEHQILSPNSDDIINETENDLFQKINIKTAIPQIIATFIVDLTVIQAGINLVFSSILLPQLSEASSSRIVISKKEGSWIASLVTISLPIGSMIVGPLMDYIGRKRVIFITTFIFFVSWLLMFLAFNVYLIYIARILAGIAAGLSTAAIIYVSEITHPELRAMMLNQNSVFVSLGILLTCILGLFFEWRTIAIIFCGLSVVSAMCIFIIPESPHWYITFQTNKEHLAKKSLKWIYRDLKLCSLHFSLLMASKKVVMNPIVQPKNRFQEFIKIYTEPKIYKPFILLLTVFIFQQLSGCYVIIFYALNLFLKIEENFGQSINEYESLFLLGLIRFVMSIISVISSRKCGRRPLMCISGVGMTLSILCAGFCLYSANNYFILLCLLGYVCFSAIGFLIIPWTLIGELFPTEVKGKLGGVIVGIAYVLMFIVVKTFPNTLEYFGVQGIFYFFSTVSLLGTICVYLFLPETLGKNFNEIEQYFMNLKF